MELDEYVFMMVKAGTKHTLIKEHIRKVLDEMEAQKQEEIKDALAEGFQRGVEYESRLRNEDI